jgi:hypothetical protein
MDDSLPTPTRDPIRMRHDLDEFGFALVADALNPTQTGALLARLIEQTQGEVKFARALYDGGPGTPNQRVFNPINKGQVFRDLTLHPLIDDVTLENHEFHMHQIHFLVESQNNFEVNGSEQVPYIDGQMLDTIQVPFWDGNPSDPFPSVTVRMDFQGVVPGSFVYHCHIAEHEDGGMMAIIQVTSSPTAGLFEKFKLAFDSLEWFGASDSPASAWCGRASSPARRQLLKTELPDSGVPRTSQTDNGPQLQAASD